MKLEKEEIQKIKQYQEDINNIIYSFGKIETEIQTLNFKKNQLIIELDKLKEKEFNILNEFKQKYGEGSIDLDKEEFNPF